ncbi:hypothetical protein B0H12DRAFT_1075069 [Mycena haematopus]|nr:hypothetical protein B0H12DRAFT_1075069 [Mycena haematopus]
MEGEWGGGVSQPRKKNFCRKNVPASLPTWKSTDDYRWVVNDEQQCRPTASKDASKNILIWLKISLESQRSVCLCEFPDTLRELWQVRCNCLVRTVFIRSAYAKTCTEAKNSPLRCCLSQVLVLAVTVSGGTGMPCTDEMHAVDSDSDFTGIPPSMIAFLKRIFASIELATRNSCGYINQVASSEGGASSIHLLPPIPWSFTYVFGPIAWHAPPAVHVGPASL